jgi:endonuclease YncB( thermonuclease family)
MTQSHHTQTNKDLLVVTKIIDGDTLVGNYQGVSETVRLIGVNAPEMGSCHSVQSKDFLSMLTYKKRLTAEQGQTKRDKYGRLLLYIHNDAQEIFINDELAKAGTAHVMTVGNNTKHASLFAASVSNARYKKAGLWGGC